MRIIAIIALLACVAWQSDARAQDESEGRVIPSRGGLLKRNPLVKGKTTTTTTPAPQEEVEYEEDAEYADGEAQEPSTEAPPSSTEGKRLVAGGVRPFRSNTDLLEALKRRRAQAAEAKHGHSTSYSPSVIQEVTEAPAKSSAFNKKRFSSVPKETNNEEAPASSKPTRGRFGRPASRSIPESETEQVNEAAPLVRTGRTFRRN